MAVSVGSFVLDGVDAVLCSVEVAALDSRTPRTTVVGLPDTAVRESVERVQGALASAGIDYPAGRITINLAPASMRKEGPCYDLPIAVGLMLVDDVLGAGGAARARDCLFAGELTLRGGVADVRGAVALAELARSRGISRVVLSPASAAQAALVPGVSVSAASSLIEVINDLTGVRPLPCAQPLPATAPDWHVDLQSVRGQTLPRRALAVAAAGWHNLLMVGPPGTGKTTLARCLPGILPEPSRAESIEYARIASVAGRTTCVTSRPFRSPHHTASAAAIVGGGTRPRPGELTLAHGGVLFLDELPEFPRAALEAMREPLERDEVIVARVNGTVRFPSRVLLVAAMNPTKDGYGRFGSDRSSRNISSPLLDRIDLHVEVPAVRIDDLDGPPHEQDSASVRACIQAAWARQRSRQGEVPNGRLDHAALDDLALMTTSARSLLVNAVESLGLSARAWDRIRRVSRTIADLNDADRIDDTHVAEAVQYRWLDRTR